MAYYLGRDIDIAITTEHDEYGIGLVTSSNEQFAGALAPAEPAPEVEAPAEPACEMPDGEG